MELERFCVPVGDSIPVDPSGFLVSSSFWYSGSWTAVPLAEACSASAVLLGEAGIGKSHALSTVLKTRKNSRNSGAYAQVDLGEVRSWEDLIRKARPVLCQLPLSSPSSGPASGDDGAPSEHLLLLDGVDECQATGKELAGWFTDLADTYDCRSLQVLIACRRMAYTDTLRQAVTTAFGITDNHTYALAPLRQSDLTDAAKARHIDPDRFVEAVSAAGAQSLARTPLALGLLLDTFLEQGSLPTTRADLYAFALPHTVMHQGEDRAPQELVGSQDQRFAIAARLACYCLLTGADGITMMRRPAPGRTLLPIDTFLGAREDTTGESFVIERPLIESVLHSSLFSSRGPAAAGPAHTSIASYLTARHLCDHRLPKEQLQGLLVHRGEIDTPGIPTDLHELAAWIVAMRPDLGPWLIATDPHAIASYSSYISDPHCIELIVDGLLQQARENAPRSDRYWQYVTSLRHPGLSGQLTRALDDATTRPTQGVHELELILTLTAENQVAELLPVVASIACDPQRDHGLRRMAAQCVRRAAGNPGTPLLKPILAELTRHPERDPDDSLRSAALDTCWPWLTTDELITALTPPRTNPSSYSYVCTRIPSLLTDDQVMPFLNWASTRVMDPASPWAGWSGADTVIEGLLDRALSGPNAEARVPVVAAHLRPYLRSYPSLAVPTPLRARPNDPGDQQPRLLRRALVHELITLATDAEDAFQLAEGWDTRPRHAFRWNPASDTDGEREHRTSLLDAADLAWLVGIEMDLTDTQAPHAWPALEHVWNLARITDTGQDIAWATRGTRVWSKVFAHGFEAIPVDSPYANQLRSREARRQARTQPWDGRAEYVSSTRTLFTQAESGDGDSFVALFRHLHYDPETGGYAVTDFDSDLLSLPGTIVLPDGHGPRLLTAARRFVTENLPEDDGWINTRDIPWQPWAAVTAFTTLIRDKALMTLPASQWRAWAPALLAFPLTSTAARHIDPRLRLLEMAHPHGAQELEATYDTLVRKCFTAQESQASLDLVSAIWSSELETRLLRTLTDLTAQAHENPTGPAGHEVLVRVLSGLLEHSSSPIRHQTLERFGAPLRDPDPAHDDQLDAMYLRVLLDKAPEEIWPTAEHRLLADPIVLDAVAESFLHSNRTQPWLARLSTPAVAQIARLLLDHNSPASSSDLPPTQHSTAVLSHLASRATDEAIHFLSTLAGERPQNSVLQELLQEAEQTRWERSWVRPTPDELSKLIQDPRRRLVKDGTDLLDLVLVLLAKIQEDLTQGTLPAAILWNETKFGPLPGGKKTAQRLRFPKDENLVSDYLTHSLRRELTDNGILINREVQVYRNIKGAGDRIDLLLQAPTATPPRRDEPIAQLAIEVKGNWHDKLATAMETQLADDYLTALHTRNGLYLIAYFPHDQWTASERKRPSADQTWESLRETYDAQAAQLSERRNLDVRAFVLDCSLRDSASRNT